MSGPFFACDAVLNAPISVSVDWGTSLILTFGWAASYFEIIAFIHWLAPGASLSAQYQYVSFPSPALPPPLVLLLPPLEPPPQAATTAAVATSAAARAARVLSVRTMPSPPPEGRFDQWTIFRCVNLSRQRPRICSRVPKRKTRGRCRRSRAR